MESLCNQVAFQLAIGSQQSILNRERLGADSKCPHLFVMRQPSVHRIQRGLHLLDYNASGNHSRKIAASVADHHCVLCIRQMSKYFVLDRFGGDVVAGVEDNQVLNSADDLPIPRLVRLALIPCMKPAIAILLRFHQDASNIPEKHSGRER